MECGGEVAALESTPEGGSFAAALHGHPWHHRGSFC
jgi:hypothetical protein